MCLTQIEQAITPTHFQVWCHEKLGAIGIIQKPFDLEMIKKSIAQITQKKED